MKKSAANMKRKIEQGGSLLELAMILPIALLILMFILLVGPFMRIVIATDQASYDCAIAAAQSLNATQGYAQGVTTAQNSFNTFGLPEKHLDIQVWGSWERGGQVGCSVAYDVPSSMLPLSRVANVSDQIVNTTVVPAQYYKSEWTGD